jgi:hypothetical protein
MMPGIPGRISSWRRLAVGSIGAAFALAAFSPGLADSDPTWNAAGEVGRTSYASVPFQNDFMMLSWGSSPELAPGELFWKEGPIFTDPKTMWAAHQAADSIASKGLVPFSGSQRWQDTYEISQPAALFHGEPGWLMNERKALDLEDKPEFKAWVAWQKARPNLEVVAPDGGTIGVDWRAWGGTWGHISPLMPLAKDDWPPGMTNATYGDWYAYRWGQTAKLSGAFGIGLSDFSDSQPHLVSWQEGFNPEIIAAFAASIGKTIPGSTIPAQAKYISENLLCEWTDFLCQGYANFYAQLAKQLTLNSGHEALVIDQCGFWPSARRLYGTDPRIFAKTFPPRNLICIWDDHTMSPERDGTSMLWGIGGMVIAAAREPDVRNGGNLSADAPDFWEATRKFWPTLTADERHERGLKELKREWLETAWAHIATRQGTTRRALCFFSRTYWDAGKIDPDVQRLIQTIVPTRPFGFALYYSTAVERKVEAGVAQNGNDSPNSSYFHPQKLLDFKLGGGVVNYYVSDAGLANLKPECRPAAWLVLDRADLLQSEERGQLTEIAPILTSLDEARHFPNAPLAFSDGLTGTGFYDQDNRLIVTASNGSAADINGTMSLNGLADGPYVCEDLFTHEKTPFTIASGAASMPLTVTRWDTRALAIRAAK